MFEFFLDIECAGHPLDCLEIGVDATWDGDAGFDVNHLYLYIATTKPGDALFERYVRPSDKTVVQTRRKPDGSYESLTSFWRKIPQDDFFYAEISAAVDKRADEILDFLEASAREAA